jgi:LmbE family N-acetylglucosaminyl deacetylase
MVNIQRLTILLIGLFYAHISVAQNTVPASEIFHDLHRLQKTGKVLYIAAHPDDENTRLISYLTNFEHVDVAYLSLTRGDGGQNLIGTEIGEKLGLVRTHELLEARRRDGAKQYFTRAIDFGYSKTPKETFEFWNKNEVLSDVVRVIRQVQPDIIITRFSPEVNPDRPTHGHHTASAMLAVEGMKAAADESQYADQLEELSVWETKHLYWNTSYWFYGSVETMDKKVAERPESYVKIDVNQYMPLLGKSGSDISSDSRSQHKSQGFGNSPVLGPQWEYLELLTEGTAPAHLLDDIATTWKERTGNTKLDKVISKAIKAFDVQHPETTVDALFEIRDQIGQLEQGKFRSTKIEEVQDIILKCMGLKLNAFTKSQNVHIGQEVNSRIEASTDLSGVSLKWKLNFGGQPSSKRLTIAPGFKENITWTVPEESSQPYWLTGNRSHGLYGVSSIDDIGKAINDYSFYVVVDVMYNGHSLRKRIPLLHASNDPVKGQIIQPLTVVPNAMINLSKDVMVFAKDESKVLDIEIVAGKDKLEGYLELFVPEGWKQEPVFHKAKFTKAGEKQHFTFTITPPKGQSEGVIKALFKDDEGIYNKGMYQLKYDHIPEVALFPPAEMKAVKVDLKTEGQRIAYVTGAGDKVPDAIREMGYEVTELTVDQLLQNNLKSYDAIVLGIRALNTNESIGSANSLLSEYVQQGGNLIMQYNTSHRLKSQPLGPAKIELSRDRVTDETAEVDFLEEDHKALNSPNKITDADFDGWVQERGLYFPKSWDKTMTALLSMHDENESAKTGSLLVGQFGEGYVVYTGISFFRELPAGVPGAYRLFANLLSL